MVNKFSDYANTPSVSEAAVMDAGVVLEGQHRTQLEPSNPDEVRDIKLKSPSNCWNTYPH